MAERRRGLTANEATPVAKPVAKPKPATSKPKSQAAAARPWWWYATPAGIANEVKYRQKQQARINKGYTRVRGLPGVRGWMGPDGNFTTSIPTQRDVVLGAAKVPANAANLAINVVQRVGNGNKPADPGSTPAGRVVTGAQRALTSVLQMPQPEQRNPDDLFWQDLGENFTAGAIGGLAASGLVKATAFTGGAMANAAPWAQRALRWTAGVGIESFVATPLVDNTKGNLANAFGENAPLAVQPTDDPLSATVKSLLPNAFAEIAAAGLFLGAGEGLGAIGRQAKAAREVGDAAKARNWTVDNGFQTEADGDFDFNPAPPEPAAAPAPAASTAADAAPAATPEPAAPAPEPVAPTNLKEAENQLLGPDDADVDVEAPVYDASLPEVDLPVQALDRLDDQRLVAAASGEGPVLPEIERQLQDQQATFQVEEGLGLERVSAPTQNLADPVVDYEAQWQQLPHNTLISLASPANNPQLFDRIHLMTGRNFEELTRTDVIDGLKAIREEGITVLPNRLQGGGDMYDTNSIAIDPVRFQYKDNVNAQGQQKGNSLEGVTKWNPEVEQTNLIWDDPEDGQTYMINGHNSLAKAQELGIPTIPARKILANNAGQARIIGAKANIASGGGTAFDAAKIIRELGIQDAAGLKAAGIPLDSGLGTPGLALSKLPGDLLQQAINGELPMGRALALGGSGLDPADMIRVAQLGVQRNVSERGFAELVQMASSAPKVADSAQGGIPGMDEWLQDSSVLEKAELSVKVRAELISNKNLFGKVGKNKAAQKLSEKGGTQVNQEQVASAADVAKGVLDEFDRDKYLAGTPISELLNQGAAEIAAGAKPAVIAKRILQQLEAAAEQAPPVKPEASVPSAGTPDPEPQAGLLPAQREELKKAVIQKAIANGEVRPSETPLPEVPEGPRDLTSAQATLEDEIRLAEHYGAEDAIRQQVEMEAARAQMGWDRMTLDEKKANGMLDTWKDDQPAAGPGPAPAAAIEIPEAAGRKITAKTPEGRITSAAQSLFNWTTSADPGVKPAFRSVEEALAAVRAKGRILDPDAIPGLDMDKARADQARGLGFTPTSQAVSDAFKQFYGLKDELSSIADEGVLQGMDGPPMTILGHRQAMARQAIQDVAKEAIERITGGELGEISFEDVYKQHITPREHGGDGVKVSWQGGFYDWFDDAIKVRGLMQDSPASVMEHVYHESFHRLQFALMSLKEMEVYESVFGKIRVDDLAGMRGAKGKATIEKQSYAFQVYAAAKARGGHAILDEIRAEVVDMLDTQFPRKNGESWGGTLRGEAAVRIFQAFDRVMLYLERLNNAARGRGFTSVEDLFEKAYSGELAKSRALDFAAEQITPDQVKRYETLMRWKTDNRVAVAEISQATASIDIQINALKAQAMDGGC